MGTNDTSNQSQGVINTLLNAGAPPQTQQIAGNAIQTLLSLLQPTPSPQTANAVLGPSTINTLDNAAQYTNNPSLAAGNYDATQNTGINQEQMSQALQNLGQSGAGVTNQPQQGLGGVPVLPTQKMTIDSAKKNYNKYLDAHAAQTPPQVLANLINHPAVQNQSQPQAQITPQVQPGQSSTQASTPQSGVSNPGDNIQEQAMNIAMQKPGILGSLFKGMFEANQSAQLNVLKQAQEITQGGPPLSPTDKVSAIGNWNSALLKQHQDFQSDLSDQMKSNVDAMESFVKNTPLPTKLADWTSYNQKLQDYHTNIKDIAEKQLQGFNKYRNLQLTNPVTGQKGNKNFGVGDKVSYNGKDRIIQSINEKTGKAVLSD